MLGFWLRDHGLANYIKLEPIEVMGYAYSEDIHSAIEELEVSLKSVHFDLDDVAILDEATRMATVMI